MYTYTPYTKRRSTTAFPNCTYTVVRDRLVKNRTNVKMTAQRTNRVIPVSICIYAARVFLEMEFGYKGPPRNANDDNIRRVIIIQIENRSFP